MGHPRGQHPRFTRPTLLEGGTDIYSKICELLFGPQADAINDGDRSGHDEADDDRVFHGLQTLLIAYKLLQNR